MFATTKVAQKQIGKKILALRFMQISFKLIGVVANKLAFLMLICQVACANFALCC